MVPRTEALSYPVFAFWRALPLIKIRLAAFAPSALELEPGAGTRPFLPHPAGKTVQTLPTFFLPVASL